MEYSTAEVELWVSKIAAAGHDDLMVFVVAIVTLFLGAAFLSFGRGGSRKE